jgi:hypothetical protein
MAKDWYTLKELAEISGLSRGTVLSVLRWHGVRTVPAHPKRGVTIRVALRELLRTLPDYLTCRFGP